MDFAGEAPASSHRHRLVRFQRYVLLQGTSMSNNIGVPGTRDPSLGWVIAKRNVA